MGKSDSWDIAIEKPPRSSSNSDSQSVILKPGEIYTNDKGLGWFVTALFVVGNLAGGGIVALPTALIQTEVWPGLAIQVVMTALTTFTAYVLGRTWAILLDRWPEYREHTRKPYAEIGFRSLGVYMRNAVSVTMAITQFMIGVVYILLSSKNIHDFIKAFFGANVSFCLVILALAVCLLPVMFLKSPHDFWWAVVIAMMTTSAAVILVIIGTAFDYGTCSPHSKLPEAKATNFFLALGTMLFAYGGHTAFPTIQHDMRRPHDFTKSAFLAFAILAIMYTPMSIFGYLSYGDSLRESIINSVQNKGVQQTINILITVHLILALTIVFNPIYQEVEEVFRVPQHFSWQRVCVRAGILVGAVFVAESVPSFGPLLNLVGGSTLTLTSIVYPCLFYMFLDTRNKMIERYGSDPGVPSVHDVISHQPKWIIVTCVSVIVFGLFGGAAATFSAIRDLSTTHFELPCYVSAFQKSNDTTDNSHTNCCGVYQNISSYAGVECSKPDLKYYG